LIKNNSLTDFKALGTVIIFFPIQYRPVDGWIGYSA
jgi:hypothetical protein